MELLMMIRYLIPGLLIQKSEQLGKDLRRWKEIHHINCQDAKAMAILLWRNKEFRNLVIYRNRRHPIRRRLIGLFYPPMDTLYIDALEIGGGLYIQHGFATIITAKKIGENCRIYQQVTIGYKNGTNPPVLEDNVAVTCGAKVLGDITMHSGSLAAAGAVVVKDVPENAIAAGVPARVIGYKDPNYLSFQG